MLNRVKGSDTPVRDQRSYATRAGEAIVSKLTPARLAFYPTAVAGCVLLAWIFSQISGPGLTDAGHTLVGADFAAFYAAGRFVVEGRGADLYDFGAQRAVQVQLAAPHPLHGFVPFISPPFCALLFVPFAWFGYLSSLELWWLMSFVALVCALHLLRSELRSLTAFSTSRLVMISFLFFPTLASFLYGQTSAFTLLLYTMGYVYLRQRRDFRAGLALGVLAFKPQLIVGPMLWICAARRWQALSGVVVSAASLVLAGFAWSPAAMFEYKDVAPRLFDLLQSGVTHVGQVQADYKTWGLQSLYGFAVLLVGGNAPALGRVLGLLLSAAGGAAILICWLRRPWEPGTREWDLTSAATLALGLIVSPHLFLYDLMLLVLPVGIVWSLYPDGTSGRPLDGGSILAATAIVYVATFLGSYACLAQLTLMEWLGLHRAGIQLGTLSVLTWLWAVQRSSRATTWA